MIFYSLISTAFSSIFYGIIVTAVIMALLYILLKIISKGIVRTPVFYITGVILAILLVIQTSLMIGAIQAKGTTDAAQLYLNQILENCEGVVNAQESQQVLDAVIKEIPIIGVFVDVADFSGQKVEDLAEVMHDTIVEYLNSYIWHRVWWILGIILIACLIVILYGRGDIPTSFNNTDNRSYNGAGDLQF